MKAIATASMLLVILVTATTLLAQTLRQTLTIKNLKGIKGDVYIGWYNKAESFRTSDKAIFTKKIAVSGQSEITITFDNIPNGKYAIAVFLDENGNNKLDQNFLGIPKEKYGFSNNTSHLTRPAGFGESSFDLTDQDLRLTIILN